MLKVIQNEADSTLKYFGEFAKLNDLSKYETISK